MFLYKKKYTHIYIQTHRYTYTHLLLVSATTLSTNRVLTSKKIFPRRRESVWAKEQDRFRRDKSTMNKSDRDSSALNVCSTANLHVCMCVYMYVCMCTYVYVCECMCMCVSALKCRNCSCVYVCECMWECICVYTNKNHTWHAITYTYTTSLYAYMHIAYYMRLHTPARCTHTCTLHTTCDYIHQLAVRIHAHCILYTHAHCILYTHG